LDASALSARLLRALETHRTPPSSRDHLPSLAADVLSSAAARDFPAMFTIWAAQATGQPTSLTVDAAACWLGLYLAAKIIDDVQDREAGLLPASVAPATALNLGLTLVFASQRCLAEASSESEAARRLELLRHTNAEALAVALAQQLAWQETEADDDLLVAAWQCAAGKGGRPFALAGWLGACSVGAAPDVAEALRRFGQLIGEAVQSVDDAMDLIEAKVSDFRSPRGSLAVAYGLRVADEGDRADLVRLLAGVRGEESGAAEAMRDRLLAMGAARYLSIETGVRVMRARALLDALGDKLRPDGRALLRRTTEMFESETGSLVEGESRA